MVTGLSRTWWSRPGLEVRDGRLTVSGRDAEELAREHGTPTYVYDLTRVEEQAVELRDALRVAELHPVVRLALKAQREPAVMRFLRQRCPWVGLDVCSPGEVEWALDHDWSREEISYTGTNLSERELTPILDVGVHVNVDLLSQLERLGRRAPGSSVGLRVNPGVGASHAGGTSTRYTGDRPTKFGISAEQLDDALAIASRHALTIDTVHVHVGDGYLSDGLGVFAETMRRTAEMTRTLQRAGTPITEVNTGGGLGVPVQAGDEALDLETWASIAADHLGPLDVAVGTEPGDFLVKQSGILLAEVVSLEEREEVLFAGVDAGWNQAPDHFIYEELLDVVLTRAADAAPERPVTVSGNINEGNDLFAEDLPLPRLREGDVLALVNVGSYNASMYSAHCLRPPAGALFFEDRV
jgi:diaminopimelate decarboxylase